MKIKYDEDNIPDFSKLKIKNYDKVELVEWKAGVDRHIAADGLKRVGVLTSGGDAPGMNAAVRAIVRSGLKAGLEIYGIKRGYHGLIKGEISELGTHDVSEKIQHGGTFLMTARSKEFTTPEGVIKGAKMAEVYDLDAIIAIGGDGTFKGAAELAKTGFPVVGIPATIDNDVTSTEYTIGYDTAMNTALGAIDKLRDTASSHERCSVIEVMGRHAGYIAYNVGLACGAECILTPEVDYDMEKDVIKVILAGRNYGKKHWIVVVAEGAGSATDITKCIEKKTGIESRPTVLGYIQRGGAPTVKDRVTASLMGIHAVDCILSGKFNRLVVEKGGIITDVDITHGLKENKTISDRQIEEANRLF